MAFKGGGQGGTMTDTGYNGQLGYAWENDCSNGGTFRCRENVFQNGAWVADGIVSESFCPIIDTADYCGNTIEGGTGSGTTKDTFGIPGGFLPFGIGNIFNTDQSKFLQKLLLIIGLAIAALFLIMYMRKK